MSRKFVPGPDGTVMTAGDLPCISTSRWTPRRKALVVCAVRGGLLDRAEACRRYKITEEEFAGWERRERANGVAGLAVYPKNTFASA